MQIWKVILATCYSQDDLHMYMDIGPLEGIPIKLLHHNDFILLFRKAHGPLLQSDSNIPYEKGRSREVNSASPGQKSQSSIKVPGFVYYNQFAEELVGMLGDYILIVEPAAYSLVIQLVFETVSFKGIMLVPICNEYAELDREGDIGIKDRRLVNSNEIHFKRINDFESPFVSPLTDELEIQEILNYDILQKLIETHCQITYDRFDLIRLQERHFRPKAFSQEIRDLTQWPQQMSYDSLEKVLTQIRSFKENKTHRVTQHRQDTKPPMQNQIQSPQTIQREKIEKKAHTSKNLWTKTTVNLQNQKGESENESEASASHNGTMSPTLPVRSVKSPETQNLPPSQDLEEFQDNDLPTSSSPVRDRSGLQSSHKGNRTPQNCSIVRDRSPQNVSQKIQNYTQKERPKTNDTNARKYSYSHYKRLLAISERLEPFKENNKAFENSLRRSFNFQDLKVHVSRQDKKKSKRPKAPYLGLANKLRALNARAVDQADDFKGGWNSSDEEKNKKILVAFDKTQKDGGLKPRKKVDDTNEYEAEVSDASSNKSSVLRTKKCVEFFDYKPLAQTYGDTLGQVPRDMRPGHQIKEQTKKQPYDQSIQEIGSLMSKNYQKYKSQPSKAFLNNHAKLNKKNLQIMNKANREAVVNNINYIRKLQIRQGFHASLETGEQPQDPRSSPLHSDHASHFQSTRSGWKSQQKSKWLNTLDRRNGSLPCSRHQNVSNKYAHGMSQNEQDRQVCKTNVAQRNTSNQLCQEFQSLISQSTIQNNSRHQINQRRISSQRRNRNTHNITLSRTVENAQTDPKEGDVESLQKVINVQTIKKIITNYQESQEVRELINRDFAAIVLNSNDAVSSDNDQQHYLTDLIENENIVYVSSAGDRNNQGPQFKEINVQTGDLQTFSVHLDENKDKFRANEQESAHRSMEDDLYTLRSESLIDRETNQAGSKGVSGHNNNTHASQRHQLMNNGFQTGSMSMKRSFVQRKQTEQTIAYNNQEIGYQHNPFMKTQDLSAYRDEIMNDRFQPFSQKHTPRGFREGESLSGNRTASSKNVRPILNTMLQRLALQSETQGQLHEDQNAHSRYNDMQYFQDSFGPNAQRLQLSPKRVRLKSKSSKGKREKTYINVLQMHGYAEKSHLQSTHKHEQQPFQSSIFGAEGLSLDSYMKNNMSSQGQVPWQQTSISPQMNIINQGDGRALKIQNKLSSRQQHSRTIKIPFPQEQSIETSRTRNSDVSDQYGMTTQSISILSPMITNASNLVKRTTQSRDGALQRRKLLQRQQARRQNASQKQARDPTEENDLRNKVPYIISRRLESDNQLEGISRIEKVSQAL